MNEEHEQTYRFLTHLASISLERWNESMMDSRTLRETYNELIAVGAFFPYNNPYNGNAVNKLLKNSHIRIPEMRPKAPGNGRILMPPVVNEPNFVPLLSLDWDFTGKSRRGYSFRLDMLRVDHRLFGIRFEKREPGTDHDFPHAQVNDRSKGIKHKNDMSWLCCRKPCIPLYAKQRDSPVSLLILLYGSLYGFGELKSDFSAVDIDGKYFEEIRPYVRSP